MMLLQVLALSMGLLFAGSWLGPGASWAQTSKGVPAGTKILVALSAANRAISAVGQPPARRRSTISTRRSVRNNPSGSVISSASADNAR